MIVVGISDGRFYASKGTITYNSDLTAEALAEILLKLPVTDGMATSSTMDFPEEYGAPEGFDAHDVLDTARRIYVENQ